MADTTCRFQWLVHNPAAMRRNFEAKFCSEYPTFTRWKVTLSPIARIQLRFVQFSLRLSCVGIEREQTISTQVLIRITRGDTLVLEERDVPYDFSQENYYTYEFTTHFHHEIQDELHFLLIAIDLQFPPTFRQRRTRPGLLRHQSVLSDDLLRLYTRAFNYNMKLRSTESNETFHIHSYVIRARWNNFFDLPSLYTVSGNAFETGISPQLLREILIYMYCGRLITPAHYREDLSYMTELFQLIDAYQIHHLYKVFAIQDSGQFRVTFPNIDKNEFGVRLNFPDPLGFLLQIHVSDGCIVFKIAIRPLETIYFISYSLLSISPLPFFCRVNVGNQPANNPNGGISYFHEEDYYIRPGATNNCWPFHVDNSEEQYLHFTISLSDGTIITQVMNSQVCGYLPLPQRFETLSDHMGEMLNYGIEPDMHVTCRSRYPDHPDLTHHIHKGMFVSRVPCWWCVVTGTPERGPNEMRSFISSEAFSHALDYIYTGKCFIPNDLHSEVYAFAASGSFMALLNRLVSDE